MLLSEVAPAAPALAGLLEIALLLFAFAFVWTIRRLIQALFGWLIDLLELIPVLGGYLAKPLYAVEQAVANTLGKAEHAIDAAMGASWHLLARYLRWCWREMRSHAVLLLEIASGFYPIVVAIRAIKSLLHHTHATTTVTSAQVKTLQKEYRGIEAQLKKVERELRGIDDLGVGKRLGQIDKEIATIEAQTIPAIQQADLDAASAISNLYEWAKGKASLLGIGTFATAVAAAIGVESFRAIRCPSFLSSFGRRGCGLFNGLDDLLGLLVDLYVIENLCEVIPLLEEAYSTVAAPAISLLTAAIDEMPCVNGNQAPRLTVPRLHLPANPGLALSLP